MKKFFKNLFNKSKSEKLNLADVEQPSSSNEGDDEASDIEEAPSRSVVEEESSKPTIEEEPSGAALGGEGETSQSSVGEPKRRPRRTLLTSSVIQSTVVEDKFCAIPSVTMLLLTHDTADRISKVMDKFDSLSFDSPPPRRRSNSKNK